MIEDDLQSGGKKYFDNEIHNDPEKLSNVYTAHHQKTQQDWKFEEEKSHDEFNRRYDLITKYASRANFAPK